MLFLQQLHAYSCIFLITHLGMEQVCDKAIWKMKELQVQPNIQQTGLIHHVVSITTTCANPAVIVDAF